MVGALVVGAVAEAAPGTETRTEPVADSSATPFGLQSDFASAAAEFHVPVSVLLAVSYQETLWESHDGQPSSTGNYNVMGLTEVDSSNVARLSAADKLGDLNAAGDGRQHPAPSAAELATIDTVDMNAPALHTLDAAAALIKEPDVQLRISMKQSVRGGAALLASYERKLDGSLPADAGAWYPAVAEYDQAADRTTAAQFADRVYATISSGASLTTTDGQVVTLPASPSIQPQTDRLPALDLRSAAVPTGSGPAPECPAGLSCTFTAAAGDKYDVADRPADGDTIRQIVIDDTEGASTDSAVDGFASPAGMAASAHYVIGSDGSVTQLVPTGDIAFDAANKTVNMHSVGIDNVGFARGSWYTEQEYETTAALVQYLAGRFSIPLDRDHVIGHDDAPYALDAFVGSQQYDPGVYWNWGHLLALVGAPLSGNGQAVVGGTVTIAPSYGSGNEPTVTDCVDPAGKATACVPQPTNFVYLHTQPAAGSPLLSDPELSGAGMTPATTDSADVSDKAVYGQTFVVAQLSGNWTGIYYGGSIGWFYNPGGINAYANNAPSDTLVVTPAVGRTGIPVYGRAYPELSAYPAALQTPAVQAADSLAIAPLSQYSIKAGQAYTATPEVAGDYYSNSDVDPKDTDCATPSDCFMVIGDTMYYPIRYNHRLAFVKASDVQVITAATPPVGTFTPVAPTPVLDTTTGLGAPQAKVAAGHSIALQVQGAPGLPAFGVTAVVLTVTVTDPTGTGYVSVYPDGQPRSALSNVNFGVGESISNQVIAQVANGKVDLYDNAGTVDLAADVTGYYTNDPSGSRLVGVGPTRILDTTTGLGAAKAPVGAGSSIALKVAGAPGSGVPAAGVTAVVLNVTATDATAAGHLTAYPSGLAGVPAVSSLSYAKSSTVSGLVTVPVGGDGAVDLRSSAGAVDLTADVTGYFTASGGGSAFHSADPLRLMDTRYGTGVRKGPVGPGASVVLPVAGVPGDGVPLKATSVLLNVTVTTPTAAAELTVGPAGSTQPTMPTLHYAAGETISNLVVVPVVNGQVQFTNSGGSAQVVADLEGFYTQ